MEKISRVGLPGFKGLYYKGEIVGHDTSYDRKNVILARNRLHAWYLRKRYHKLCIDVYTKKWINTHGFVEKLSVNFNDWSGGYDK